MNVTDYLLQHELLDAVPARDCFLPKVAMTMMIEASIRVVLAFGAEPLPTRSDRKDDVSGFFDLAAPIFARDVFPISPFPALLSEMTDR